VNKRRPRLVLDGSPPRPVYRGLRRIVPLEQQVQAGVLGLLQQMPEVAWAFKQQVGAYCIVRRDATSGQAARSQLEAAARAGYFKASQIAWVQTAPEGVLDIALQLTGIGTHCELEVKQPGAKPSEAQRQRIDLIRRNGGCADWTDDIQEVPELIKAWRKQCDGGRMR
jgi:hypothetical protein